MDQSNPPADQSFNPPTPPVPPADDQQAAIGAQFPSVSAPNPAAFTPAPTTEPPAAQPPISQQYDLGQTPASQPTAPAPAEPFAQAPEQTPAPAQPPMPPAFDMGQPTAQMPQTPPMPSPGMNMGMDNGQMPMAQPMNQGQMPGMPQSQMPTMQPGQQMPPQQSMPPQPGMQQMPGMPSTDQMNPMGAHQVPQGGMPMHQSGQNMMGGMPMQQPGMMPQQGMNGGGMMDPGAMMNGGMMGGGMMGDGFPPAPPVEEDTTPANFQLGTKIPATMKVSLPPHELNFDEQKFLTLLAGSISLSKDEKKKIIESVPKLRQLQIDELIRIFEEEKQKFAALSKKHVPQLEKLVEQHLNDWMDIEAEVELAGKKDEEAAKAEEIRKQLGL